ncbi:hypothetical protein NDU88_007776 [Pleurodeles waltl]|uniref:Uncharacterized protein n=1 Tax=Pleurodeles waltl TaxID=8319 RepID=A0AAV7RSQ9_PLEWA|nr:hypothetical protein NDU88_007776 [Pleurodeles waltl]
MLASFRFRFIPRSHPRCEPLPLLLLCPTGLLLRPGVGGCWCQVLGTLTADGTNNTPLDHIAQFKETVPTPSTVPFPIFLPKDHLLIKQVERVEQSDQIESDVGQASRISKIRGKKAGKKRNRRIIKKRERKVKFEEREQLEYADTMKLGFPLKNSLNKTEGAFVVGQAQVLAQMDDPVTPMISRVRPDSSIMFPTELAHNVDKGPYLGDSFQSMGGKLRGDMAPGGQSDLPDYLQFLAIFDSDVCINQSFILSCFLNIDELNLIESSDIVRVFPDHSKVLISPAHANSGRIRICYRYPAP